MKLIIDVDKDYYEQIKYNVEHGQEYKPFEIIANGIPYEERPHGNWEVLWDVYNHCSICGFKTVYASFNFCPNCGAQMNGGEDND